MTLNVFPFPLEGIQALLEAAKTERWPSATIGAGFPAVAIKVPHLQTAWDGTPRQQVNRQVAAVRVTVWTPKGEATAGVHLAQLVRAYLLDSGSVDIWRIRPGAGPNDGTDDDTKLPFCSFTVNAETRPNVVT